MPASIPKRLIRGSLIFDWINFAVRPELHYVALADETKSVRPHGQGVFNARTAMQRFMRNPVNPFVFSVAARRVDIVGKFAFLMNQTTAAGAVCPVI